MVNFLPLQLKEHFYRLISHDFWWEFVNFYAERLIFLPFYGYRSSPFTPLKNLLSPNLGKSMSETCQDLERLSLNELVLTYLPFKYVKFPSSVSWSFDEWNQIKMLPAKQRFMKIASVIKKTKQNNDNNNNTNNNYQCRPRWDK